MSHLGLGRGFHHLNEIAAYRLSKGVSRLARDSSRETVRIDVSRTGEIKAWRLRQTSAPAAAVVRLVDKSGRAETSGRQACLSPLSPEKGRSRMLGAWDGLCQPFGMQLIHKRFRYYGKSLEQPL